MPTRSHVHEESFAAAPAQLFALLHTPSAIRQWWGANQVIVVPKVGGVWAATWGEKLDAPDYVATATLSVFEPPLHLLLADYRYHAKNEPLPFDAAFTAVFTVTEEGHGKARLRVCQAGFPADSQADAHYAACQAGWLATFIGIRAYLAQAKKLTVAE